MLSKWDTINVKEKDHNQVHLRISIDRREKVMYAKLGISNLNQFPSSLHLTQSEKINSNLVCIPNELITLHIDW